MSKPIAEMTLREVKEICNQTLLGCGGCPFIRHGSKTEDCMIYLEMPFEWDLEEQNENSPMHS